MLYYIRTMMEEKLENSLYWLVSFVINLIIFSLLSVYLSVRIEVEKALQPVELLLQEEQPVEKTELASGKIVPAYRPPQGSSSSAKSAPAGMPVLTEKAQKEPSILEEVERVVRGREKQRVEEGSATVSESIGNILAVVTPGGVGLSGSGRATVYTPPLPVISSDEPLSPFKVKVWIEPSGVVSRVQVLQKSGSPYVDQKLLEFVKGIRFEAIKENVVQTGIITFRFKGG